MQLSRTCVIRLRTTNLFRCNRKHVLWLDFQTSQTSLALMWICLSVHLAHVYRGIYICLSGYPCGLYRYMYIYVYSDAQFWAIAIFVEQVIWSSCELKIQIFVPPLHRGPTPKIITATFLLHSQLFHTAACAAVQVHQTCVSACS